MYLVRFSRVCSCFRILLRFFRFPLRSRFHRRVINCTLGRRNEKKRERSKAFKWSSQDIDLISQRNFQMMDVSAFYRALSFRRSDFSRLRDFSIGTRQLTINSSPMVWGEIKNSNICNFHCNSINYDAILSSSIFHFFFFLT